MKLRNALTAGLLTAGIMGYAGSAMAGPCVDGTGLQLDPLGMGMITGCQDAIGGPKGHGLLKGGVEVTLSDKDATLYVMHHYFPVFEGHTVALTFEVAIPVITSDSAVSGLALNINNADEDLTGNGSLFNLYMDPNPTNAGSIGAAGFSDDPGVGWGDGSGRSSDMVRIATGFARIFPSAGTDFPLTNFSNVALGGSPAAPIDVVDGLVGGVARHSLDVRGSLSLQINITEQNMEKIDGTPGDAFDDTDNIVINDLVNGSPLLLDINLFGAGINAPYTGDAPIINAASKVVGVGITYGADLNGDLTADNNFDCDGVALVDTTCDFQFQVVGNLDFASKEVPEPGVLALAGLAIGLLGFSRRRRAKLR